MKKLVFILMTLGAVRPAASQVVPGNFGIFEEALSFSLVSPGYSARIAGLGGAVTSLGGDVSSISTNPAGLGFYNRNEFSISPQINYYNTTTDYFGQETDVSFNKWTVPNFSGVINFTKDDIEKGKWRGGSFGFSFSRINDFNNRFTLFADQGGNNVPDDQRSSIIDFFIEDALASLPNAPVGLTQLAEEQFVFIPIFDADSNVIDYGSFESGFPLQEERIVREGSQNQFSFAFGGNYDDKVFIGLGINAITVDYTEETFLIEDNFNSANPIIQELSTLNVKEVEGAGVNATLGLIVRPTSKLRVGLSLTSPTSLNLTREEGFDLLTDFSDTTVVNPNPFVSSDSLVTLDEFFSESPIFVADYKIKTPLRLSLGTSYFFSKNGFVTVDAEYVDYQRADITSDEFSTVADNQTITNLYRSVWNFRAGGEYRYNIFRIRGGYEFAPSPIDFNDGIDRDKNTFTLGLGVRFKNWYADLAYSNSTFNTSRSPYELDFVESPVAITENKVETVGLTLGLLFK